jgi:hypothetical protein
MIVVMDCVVLVGSTGATVHMPTRDGETPR